MMRDAEIPLNQMIGGIVDILHRVNEFANIDNNGASGIILAASTVACIREMIEHPYVREKFIEQCKERGISTRLVLPQKETMK